MLDYLSEFTSVIKICEGKGAISPVLYFIPATQPNAHQREWREKNDSMNGQGK